LDCHSCAKCFDAAIELEKAAHDYYQRMAQLFQDEKLAAAVFSDLALDETTHAQSLERAKISGCHADSIHAKSDSFIKALEKLHDLIRVQTLAVPRNLDEVFEFSRQVERSEINDIYISLVTETMNSPEGTQFIISVIETHLQRANSLSKTYDLDQRKLIVPHI